MGQGFIRIVKKIVMHDGETRHSVGRAGCDEIHRHHSSSHRVTPSALESS